MTAPAPRSDTEIRADLAEASRLIQDARDARDLLHMLAMDVEPLLARALAAEARVAEVEAELAASSETMIESAKAKIALLRHRPAARGPGQVVVGSTPPIQSDPPLAPPRPANIWVNADGTTQPVVTGTASAPSPDEACHHAATFDAVLACPRCLLATMENNRARADAAEARAVKAEQARDFVRARIALLIEANAARLPHSCHYTGIGNDALRGALAEPVTDTTEDGDS